ncbi:MAG: hypothetical protein HC895_15660 [Leptolyngbyaceae cyanobacterium SM1_3_5]|nr:hypothetical protein [Leptolyngbyaceae cyanobacterium SM1_3_5]
MTASPFSLSGAGAASDQAIDIASHSADFVSNGDLMHEPTSAIERRQSSLAEQRGSFSAFLAR